MSIYIGRQIANDELDLYNSSNKLYLKSKNSSNILYLNYHADSYSNACIIFKNDYQIGYINNKISFYNSSNLLTIDNNSIHSYKDIILHSNIEIIDYYKTSNNINYFNNNYLLTFNNISDTFKINYNNIPLININKNECRIYNSNIYTSNLTIHPDCILYTNYIDSPNLNPVVIRNMAFAESLRIITAKIVHSLNIDTRIIFNNYANIMPNDSMNITTPFDLTTWTNYVIDNHINADDLLFKAPNIDIKKIITSNFGNGNNIGGDNILEFKIYNGVETSNTIKVLSINNSGYINIGDTSNLDTPLFIKINPINSNIFQYTNLNNINNNFCIGSNGYINIGTSNLSSNQLYIKKYDVNDPYNTELISLNINYDNTIAKYGITNIKNVSFINNDTLTDFNIIELGNDKYIITNNYISNNINIYNDIYNNINYYSSLLIELPNINSIASNLYIKYPNNGFYITSNIIDNNSNINLDIILYPSNLSSIPLEFISNNYNKIVKIKTIANKTLFNNFYIYKSTYIFNYNGLYKNNTSKILTASSNNNIVYSISHNGNVGLGTDFTDKYKLYIPDNALINNIDCSIISNYLKSNISFENNNLNNINILNVSNINASSIKSNSNIFNVIDNKYININSNINILSSAFLDVNSKSSFGYSNIYNNYIMNINIPYSGNGNAIVIYNQYDNINPNILLLGDNDNSFPFINIKNKKINANIKITSTNNFQIYTNDIQNNKNISLIYNDITKNYISLYDDNFSIFKDNDKNVKIFAGTPKYNNNISIDPTDWFNTIKNNGIISSYPSFNVYGDLNLRNTYNNPILVSSTTVNNTIKIGMGILPPSSTDIYDMNINLNTNFTSNVYINSNLYISGTVLTPSDSNIKSNIKKINNSIEKISNINGYTYTRIDTGKNETGLLAQEVIEILPEVINYNDITKLYNISYGNLCGLLIEGIKDLNERIKKLEKKMINI